MRNTNDSIFVQFRYQQKYITYFEFFWIIVLFCIVCYFYDENEAVSKRDEENHIQPVQFLELKSPSVRNISEGPQNDNYYKVNYNVHVFYYAWYGNPEVDGEFRHWNYKYAPAWEKNDRIASPVDLHYPPMDIGSNYYPSLGCYSSNDPDVIDSHMKLIREAGIGVVVISWKPPDHIDSPYNILQMYFDIAARYKLKITIHIQHYRGRNPVSLREHLRIFINRFGNHPSLYTVGKNKRKGSKKLPLIYVYDSYIIPEGDWAEILGTNTQLTIRNSEIDAIFIGLLADVQHRNHIRNSKFDGFYTYFGANDFTYGSTWENWKGIASFAEENKLIFIPSVSPGYADTRVRPWNIQGVKGRGNGQYYNVSWEQAIRVRPRYVSISSFNDWHEGTQIEPASPKMQLNFQSLNYGAQGPYYYISLTREWVDKFMNHHPK